MTSDQKAHQDALDYACARGRWLAGHDLLFKFIGPQRLKAKCGNSAVVSQDDLILQTLDANNGNIAATSRLLKVSRGTIYNRLKL